MHTYQALPVLRRLCPVLSRNLPQPGLCQTRNVGQHQGWAVLPVLAVLLLLLLLLPLLRSGSPEQLRLPVDILLLLLL